MNLVSQYSRERNAWCVYRKVEDADLGTVLRFLWVCADEDSSIELATRVGNGEAICKGSSTLGNNCGHCVKCTHTVPDFKVRRMRAKKTVQEMVMKGDELIEVRPNGFRNVKYPVGATCLDFGYLEHNGFKMSEYFEDITDEVKCGVIGCNNKATRTWSGHPTCSEC